MVMPISNYEESREKRIEENRKRMDELNIKKLSKSLHHPKPSPMKKAKQRVQRQPVEPTRRSSRVADLPPTSYTEDPIEPMERAARSKSSGHGPRQRADRVYASDVDRENTTQRAKNLQSGLDKNIPSLVKPLSHSMITRGFWLALDRTFCRKHLPTRDVFVNLVDEDGNEAQALYLHKKTGLSAKWRRFAIDHELEDGDALVFQLIKPITFNVFIIRVNDPRD